MNFIFCCLCSNCNNAIKVFFCCIFRICNRWCNCYLIYIWIFCIKFCSKYFFSCSTWTFTLYFNSIVVKLSRNIFKSLCDESFVSCLFIINKSIFDIFDMLNQVYVLICISNVTSRIKIIFFCINILFNDNILKFCNNI